MEFDADLHAVALTGSDALVSALWKCERAGITSNGAWQTLSTLLGYGKYTSDVFHHQRRHEKRLSEALARKEKPTPFVLSLRSAYRPGPAPHFHEADDPALYVDPASGNPTSEPVRSERDDDEQDDEIA
jgi:hypothetical protein